MNRRRKHNLVMTKLFGILAPVIVVCFSATMLFAAGTPSGTVITNSVTFTYNFGSQSGLTATASTSLVVDNKVNLVVTSLGNVSVIPGEKNRALLFTVTNVGNTSQRYKLEAGPVFSAENVEFTNVRIYADKDNSGGFSQDDLAYATPVTFGDVQPDQTLKIMVVADVPDTVADGKTSQYYLLATTVDAGTTADTRQTQGANTAGVDVVFADTNGAVDGSRDGKHSAAGQFTANLPTVNILKEVNIISDPLNADTPRANAGAILRYTLSVTVSGNGKAENIVITDAIPAGTQYINGSIKLNGNALTDAKDADAGSFDNNTVNVNLGDQTKNSPRQIVTFDIKIN